MANYDLKSYAISKLPVFGMFRLLAPLRFDSNQDGRLSFEEFASAPGTLLISYYTSPIANTHTCGDAFQDGERMPLKGGAFLNVCVCVFFFLCLFVFLFLLVGTQGRRKGNERKRKKNMKWKRKRKRKGKGKVKEGRNKGTKAGGKV